MNDNVSFEVGEGRVRWRKQLTPDRRWSQRIDLQGIEPEQFHLVADNITQYKDRLYVTKLSALGEDQLGIIPLDSPDLVIDHSFNRGKQYAYLIHQLRLRKSVRIIPTNNGPLTKNDRFAYDDRDVYTWTDTGVRITPSPCPTKARIRGENVYEFHNRDIIIPLTDESCQNAVDEQTLKP